MDVLQKIVQVEQRQLPSGLAVGRYTLKVFFEQYNGDYRTDYVVDDHFFAVRSN